ncbi:MAG: amidohydrolase, partial [Deltaproteobacteria bacterium]
YVSCEPEEAGVAFAADMLGPDFILYASDYPHWDSDFPESTRSLTRRTDLSEEVKTRVLGENARAFYRLGS